MPYVFTMSLRLAQAQHVTHAKVTHTQRLTEHMF